MRKLLPILCLTVFQCVSYFAVAQEIILIRHAEVYLETGGWMVPKKAVQLREAYDTSPVRKFSPDSILAGYPQRKTDTVYVSSLNRSITTGWLLYGDSAVIVSTPFLDEFDLEIVKLPFILPYKGWTIISRVFWVLGHNKGDSETHKETKKRVKEIANFIEDKLKYNQQVIFVTHGFLNRNLAKELKRRDWEVTQNRGKKNLGATVLKK